MDVSARFAGAVVSCAGRRDPARDVGAARAPDDDIREALDAVDALTWVELLPDELDTVVGSGGRQLTDAQAQQIALARLVLADPHTLVLDEATSLIDPRAAGTWSAPWWRCCTAAP